MERQPDLPKCDMLLIDGKGIFWRAADAYADLSIDQNGHDPLHTGGIYGFLVILARIYRQVGGVVIVCWDDWLNGPAARKRMYPEYKRRPPLAEQPIERQDQIKRMDAQQKTLIEILSLLGVRQVVSREWEADDVMGTLAKAFTGKPIHIFSGDKDMYQCITPTTSVVRPMPRGVYSLMTPENVKEAHGVTPEQWIDWKAMVGDDGDNIPGCPNVGPKKATQILQIFGTLDAALGADIKTWKDKGLSQKLAECLLQNKEIVDLSWALSRIKTDAPMEFMATDRQWKRAKDMLLNLKFFSLFQHGRLDDLKELGEVSTG